MKLKVSTIQIIMLLAVICLPALLHAEPGFPDDVDEVPIDGGLSLLVAAGVGYGVRKIKKTRANKHDKS
jgi:hypothetical protein